MKQHKVTLALNPDQSTLASDSGGTVFSNDSKQYQFLLKLPPSNVPIQHSKISLLINRIYRKEYDLPPAVNGVITWPVPQELFGSNANVVAEVTVYYTDGSNNAGKFLFRLRKSIHDYGAAKQYVPETPQTMPIATPDSVGGVKAGAGVTVAADGTLSVALDNSAVESAVKDYISSDTDTGLATKDYVDGRIEATTTISDEQLKNWVEQALSTANNSTLNTKGSTNNARYI